MKITHLALSLALILGAVPARADECERRAFCEYHKEYGDWEGEDEVSDGVQYRIYVHSVVEQGKMTKHRFRVRCDAATTSSSAPTCERRAMCELHHEFGDWEGEDEVSDGENYRVYVHSVAAEDRDTGGFEKHSFRVRCDPPR